MSSKAKKEFSKLSKPELITKCERLKLPTTGSKWDLIDRILKYNKKTQQKSQKKKNKNFLNKTKKKFDILSGREATKFILNAYIHQIKICTGNYNIENELIVIISSYLGKNILMRFDICPYNYIDKEILNFGKKIQRGKHNGQFIDGDSDTIEHRVEIIYGCSIGFKYDIHSWKIKINNIQYEDDNIDYHIGYNDCIGIAANIKIDDNTRCIIKTDELYFIEGGENIIYGSYESKIKLDKKTKIGNLWKSKDVINVILNCNKWTLIFKINGQKVGKIIKIAKNKTYYPVIYSQTDFSKFSLTYYRIIA